MWHSIRVGFCRHKNRLFLLLALAGVFQFCTTEIDINGNGPSIPVVYCLLNPEDSVQYLRLSKTFHTYSAERIEKPSANDLVFDEEPEIYLLEDGTGNRQTFYRYNGIDTIQRDSGYFPVEGMKLFSAKIKLIPGSLYTLIVWFHSNNLIVFGETRSYGSEFKIIDPVLVPYRKADLFPGQDYYVRFCPVINAQIYQTTLTFTYDEIREGIPTRKFMQMKPDPMFNEDLKVPFLEQRISGERFLIEVARNIKPELGIIRKPVCFSFNIACGGIELATSVLSLTQISAFSNIEYSNLENAVGIFSSLDRRYIENVPLSDFTIDSLAASSYTSHLGFLSTKEILKYEEVFNPAHMR